MEPVSERLTVEQQVSLVSGSSQWRTQPIPEVGLRAATLSDGPHGLRFQAGDGDHLGQGLSEPATCFPPAVTLASTWDEDLARQAGAALAVEARAFGVDVVLGPGLNIKRHPLCGRNFEYFSEDPLLAGRLAAAMVDGLQDGGVGACLKHFAVNNQEGHRMVVDAIVDERTLRELYLAGFEHAVKASRPWAVMSSYNMVNGEYVGESARLLDEILRGEWGFDGLVMSDWAAVSERWRGLLAGLDLEMPSSDGLFDEETLAAIADGRLPQEKVATSAQRVVDLVDRSPLASSGSLPVDEHDALALRVATEGTVLLANDGLLPLTGAESIALIGAFAEQPRFQGAGSSLVNAVRVTTAREALAARGATVSFEAGYDAGRSGSDPALIDRAVEAARRADVAVVMVGLPTTHESEGFDRVTLALPAQHDALVAAVAAANPRTVVALSNGAPVLMPWQDDVAAIVESYVGGQASGAALVSVLFGDAEPGGRLAETFPASLDDVASDPWFPGRTRQVQHREGLFVGYRHHVTTGVAPLFPFGHGLGYTAFAWSDATLDRSELAPGEGLTLTLTVTNTGARAGSDVVQVYLADRSGVVLRPERQLAGFAKVRLDPGASTVVSVEVPARAFQFYDVEASDWLTPDGPFELLVARSSADVEARLPGRVVNGVTSAAEPADTPAIAGSAAEFERRLRRPVPPVAAARPFTRNSTIDELSATGIGRALRRLLLAAAVEGIPEDDTATRLMFQRGVEELPLRAAAIFSEGRIRLPAVDAILALANRDVRGLGGVASASLRRLSARLRR